MIDAKTLFDGIYDFSRTSIHIISERVSHTV